MRSVLVTPSSVKSLARIIIALSDHLPAVLQHLAKFLGANIILKRTVTIMGVFILFIFFIIYLKLANLHIFLYLYFLQFYSIKSVKYITLSKIRDKLLRYKCFM